MSRVFVHLFLGLAACASVSQSQIPGTPARATTDAMANADAADAPAGAPAPRDAGAGATDRTRSGSLTAGASDPGADADFAAARTRFDSGDHYGARVSLEAFVARHADHPSRGAADVMLGRLALGRGDALSAKKVLEPLAGAPADAGAGVNTAPGTSARYYLGLAEVRLGNAARARELLLPFLAKKPGDAVPADDAAIELRGALAEATAPADPIGALDLLDGYMRVAREHEKAWARERGATIAARVTPEIAWRAYGAAPPSGLARAVLGSKAAGYLRARGDAAGAAFIESETGAVRHALCLDVATARVGPGDPTRIGLALPLSGKFQVVGEAALRAAMLAGPVPAPSAGGGAPPPAQLFVRDTATDSERALRGVSELTRTEAVIGIVGAAGGKTGAAAIAHASQDGIPLLVLEDTAPGALTSAFQIMHTPDARAAALARQALKQGVRKFAMLGPDSNVGKRLRDAFRKAVTDGGGTIVVDSAYVAGATSFAGAIALLKKVFFEAVFVPDSAERLPLIAPALAVADLWPQPWNKPRAAPAKGQPRSVLLLSTANELSTKLLDSAGRYVQGALLCPGFFADETDPRARGFVEAYRAAYGSEPHATEAYTYDAVSTLRAVTQRGARTRVDVLKALGLPGGAPVWQGLTGNVTFGPDHGRVDSPLVYVVSGDDIRAVK